MNILFSILFNLAFAQESCLPEDLNISKIFLGFYEKVTPTGCIIKNKAERLDIAKIPKSRLKITQNLIKIQINNVNNPTIAPYPGYVSQKVHCHKGKAKKFDFKQKKIRFEGYRLVGSKRYVFEPCPEKILKWAYFGILYCSNDKAFKIQYFSDSSLENSFNSFLEKVECK